MATEMDIGILDAGEEMTRCKGPAADGSCPEAAIGDVVPCAGRTVVVGRTARPHPHAVSGGATVCPVTLATMIALKPDSTFFLDDVD